MLDYLNRTGQKRTAGTKLLGVFEADEILLYAPLLRWYLEHGLQLQVVYTTVEYQPEKCLAWFVEQVTEARRMGDLDKEKVILSEVFRFLGNSSLAVAKSSKLWKDTPTLAIPKTKKLWTGHYGQHGSSTSRKLVLRTR